MAKCFCGCGRRVKLSRRPMNTSGERVSQVLGVLQHEFSTPEIAELRNEHVESFLAMGAAHREGLLAITHNEANPAGFDVPMMRAWLQDAWTMESELEGVRLGVAEGDSAEQALNTVHMGRWVRQSGMDEEEAARYLLDLQREGRPMPWQEGG